MPNLYPFCANKPPFPLVGTDQELTQIARQIPYAIGQFTVNEFCHELAFRSMSEEKR
jgi:hypothetical protein